MLSCIYIDFERDDEGAIIEIGAVHVETNLVQREFHCFINQSTNSSFHYYRCAENSHCLPAPILKLNGVRMHDAQHDFNLFMLSILKPVTIKGFGDDVNEANLKMVFPFLNTMKHVTYKQVSLPSWKQRQFEPSHIATSTMKKVSGLLSCKPSYHNVPYFPHWKRKGKQPNHTQLSKLGYGHHCALIDAYELAFYDEALPNYCCDAHFQKILNYETTILNFESLNITYDPIIIDDSLIFLDSVE